MMGDMTLLFTYQAESLHVMSMKKCLSWFNENIFLEKALGYIGWSLVFFYYCMAQHEWKALL